MSTIIEFTASKNDIFYNVKRHSGNDSKRSFNNDVENNENSESNRDDDDEIEQYSDGTIDLHSNSDYFIIRFVSKDV